MQHSFSRVTHSAPVACYYSSFQVPRTNGNKHAISICRVPLIALEVLSNDLQGKHTKNNPKMQATTKQRLTCARSAAHLGQFRQRYTPSKYLVQRLAICDNVRMVVGARPREHGKGGLDLWKLIALKRSSLKTAGGHACIHTYIHTYIHVWGRDSAIGRALARRAAVGSIRSIMPQNDIDATHTCGRSAINMGTAHAMHIDSHINYYLLLPVCSAWLGVWRC
jgi:hypothetical protein